jgi:hypothetical protein
VGDLATIHDLTLDGTSIQQSTIGIHLEITRGINEIPVHRGEDDTVPSRPGRVAYPFAPDVLPLELEGFVLGTGDTVEAQQSAFRQYVIGLRTLLETAAANPKVLAGVLEDGSTASINVRVIDFTCPEVVAGLAAEPKVALQSVDPDWVTTPP